jgi:FPC/CPF motif-containing protein YcgG
MLVQTSPETGIKRRRIQTGKLFTKPELFSGDLLTSCRQRGALDGFADRVGSESFPCLFARKAWVSETVRFAFAECSGIDEFDDVLVVLTDYTNFVKNTPLGNRLFSPLVLFFVAAKLDSDNLHELGWRVLNWVHSLDPARWPDDVAKDPDNPSWCFCFNGVQLFVNMSTPEHRDLRSRNLGDYLTFVINPRENFDAVASMKTRSGRLVRENIRKRVADYNGGLIPEELGFFGDENNREWQQYQLEESNLPRPAQCPFSQNTTPHAPAQKDAAGGGLSSGSRNDPALAQTK